MKLNQISRNDFEKSATISATKANNQNQCQPFHAALVKNHPSPISVLFPIWQFLSISIFKIVKLPYPVFSLASPFFYLTPTESERNKEPFTRRGDPCGRPELVVVRGNRKGLPLVLPDS
jgi:hypothetical protein